MPLPLLLFLISPLAAPKSLSSGSCAFGTSTGIASVKFSIIGTDNVKEFLDLPQGSFIIGIVPQFSTAYWVCLLAEPLYYLLYGNRGRQD
jgi:hypothetical protein